MMPLYDYKCPVCQARREVLLKLAELDSAIPHCRHCGAAMNRQLSAPMVVGDYPPYDCPITGKRIEGRRAHIENLAKHGCRLYEPGETQDAIAHRKAKEVELDRKIEESYDRTIAGWPTDKRDKLAAEMEAGVSASYERISPTTTN